MVSLLLRQLNWSLIDVMLPLPQGATHCFLLSLLATLLTGGACQSVFSTPLFGQPAAIAAEKRFGPFNAIANNLSGLDIKGKLNEIYDKYKGPLWGKGNDPNNYGQLIAEISATQPGTTKGGTYTVPGSGITHVTADKSEAAQDASQVAESKGSLPIGGRPDDLATSASGINKATSSPDKSARSTRGTRNSRNRRHRRQRDREHSHHRHHHHHHPDSHRPYHNAYRNYGPYDPYYPASSNSVYSRYQPHLPPLPPHPSIASSPFLSQALSSTQYTNVPPAIIGISAGTAAAASSSSSPSDSSSRSPSSSSPSSPNTAAVATSAAGQMSNAFGSMLPPLAPYPPSPYSNLAALSALPAHQINPLINALLLNQLALASVTTTTASPISSTKKSKSKKGNKKSASNSKNLALTTSINTEDGTISIGGIDPEHVIRFVGGVVQSTGLNKALGSALSTVMTTVSKVGTQVVKQAVHSISDSVTLSLNHPAQSQMARVSGKRRKAAPINTQRIGQTLLKLTNPLTSDTTSDTDSLGVEHNGESDSVAESAPEEVEPSEETIKEEVEEEEGEERVKRDKDGVLEETPTEEDTAKAVQQVRRRKKKVNRIRINRLKPGQLKNDPNVRTLTLGGTNISLRSTDKGGFSIAIGDSGDRRKDQGFVRPTQKEEETSSAASVSSHP